MRPVAISSGQIDCNGLKNAALPRQEVVAGRLGAKLPVTEHAAIVGICWVSISAWPNGPSSRGTGFSIPALNTVP